MEKGYHKRLKIGVLSFNTADLFYFCGLLLLFVFLFWRAPYGMANTDESYYLSLAYRLYQGDSMMVEEWGIIQLSSFLLYPFVSLYMAVFQTTDGILLAGRYLYLGLCTISALFIYIRLKKIDQIAAMVASFCIMLYAPFGVAATSYNSLCILLLEVMLVILATEEKFSRITCYCLGWLFAGAVLCCPFLIIPLFLYICALAVYAFIKRKKWNTAIYHQWRVVIGIVLGGGTLCLLFCIFVFQKASLQNILASIPYIINDGSHPISFISKCYNYLADMVSKYRLCLPLFAVELVIAIIMGCTKSHKYRQLGMIVLLCLTTLCELIVWKTMHFINFIFVPIVFLAAILFWLYRKDSLISKMFYLLFLPGVIYSVCLHFSSNQNAYAIASAMTVSVSGSIVIIMKTCKKLMYEQSITSKNILRFVLCVVLGVLLFSEAELRYTNVFWDLDIHTQTVYISDGPEKGLYTREGLADSYESLCDSIALLRQKYDTENVLFVTESFQTMYYLFDGIGTGCPSSWNIFDQERMNAYYEINPHKKPTVIYCKKKYDLSFLNEILQEYEIAEENEEVAVYVRRESVQ